MSDPLSFRLRLPSRPVSVGVARCVVRALAYLVDIDMIERTELVLSELVTNAIRHGSADPDDVVDVELVVSGDAVSGQVCDAGPPFEVPHHRPEAQQIGGYGLYIVQQVSELRVAHAGSGNAVSFSVGRPTPV